jgi:DNA-directed RNA polymerase specialized sigma24 family protein
MCSAWLRKRYPNFHRLRVRLRYLLAQDPRFALWEAASGDTVCGFREDAGGAAVACAETLTGECPRSVSPGDTLAFLFRASGDPLRLNDLARVCAAVWGVHDGVAEMQEDIAATAAAPSAEDLHHRRQLTALWAEIRELPPRQAAALLLNLRADDGECATSLLVLTGTASLRELASVTNVPAEEFAELWKRLPLSDLEIAERLGLSRQQVINLRKCARERLRRRMGDL